MMIPENFCGYKWTGYKLLLNLELLLKKPLLHWVLWRYTNGRMLLTDSELFLKNFPAAPQNSELKKNYLLLT
jgi:hypothetical protein